MKDSWIARHGWAIGATAGASAIALEALMWSETLPDLAPADRAGIRVVMLIATFVPPIGALIAELRTARRKQSPTEPLKAAFTFGYHLGHQHGRQGTHEPKSNPSGTPDGGSDGGRLRAA